MKGGGVRDGVLMKSVDEECVCERWSVDEEC